jgi:hypothetical protein
MRSILLEPSLFLSIRIDSEGLLILMSADVGIAAKFVDKYHRSDIPAETVAFPQPIHRVGLSNCLLASYFDFRQTFPSFCPIRLKFDSYFISLQRFLAFRRFPDVIGLGLSLDVIFI